MSSTFTKPRSGPTFAAWRGMVKQAHASGLPLFDEWRVSFDNFVMDMGDAPSKQAGLRMLEPDNGFRPGNVIWDN